MTAVLTHAFAPSGTWSVPLEPYRPCPKVDSVSPAAVGGQLQSKSRSGSGMELVVNAPQALARDVGVDLRRRDVGVAEHRLERAQVGATFEQMRREGMAKDVRCQDP